VTVITHVKRIYLGREKKNLKYNLGRQRLVQNRNNGKNLLTLNVASQMYRDIIYQSWDDDNLSDSSE